MSFLPPHGCAAVPSPEQPKDAGKWGRQQARRKAGALRPSPGALGYLQAKPWCTGAPPNPQRPDEQKSGTVCTTPTMQPALTPEGRHRDNDRTARGMHHPALAGGVTPPHDDCHCRWGWGRTTAAPLLRLVPHPPCALNHALSRWPACSASTFKRSNDRATSN